MNKNLFIWIALCFTTSTVIVTALFFMSGQMKDNRNSFLRQFPPHPAMEGDTLNIKYDSYYIAGGTPYHIYLGNYRAPLHMLVLNMALTDTQRVKLKVKGIMEQKFWSARVKVDSPDYYLTDGAVPIIFRGNTTDWTAEKFPNDSIYFREIVPLNSGSYAVKSLSGSTGENILGKVTSLPPYQTFTTGILQKQQDGVFCTDGLMRYNRGTSQLIYLYYYRNQFMVMDTSLNLLFRGNTIDTISTARIRAATIESENTKTLASPPWFVNKGFDTSGRWLFVHSNMLAKNEHRKAFDQGSVIDVYDITDGKYVFSFYIYHFNRTKKMIEFRVFGNNVVVLYDRLIQVYRLVPRFFQKEEHARM